MCLFYPYFHRCASCAYYLTQCRIVYTSKHCEVHIPVERPISFFRRRNGVGISYRNGQAMEWSPRCQIEFFLRIVSTDPFDCLTDSGVIPFFENPALSWLRIIHEVERERLRWKKSLSAILKSATSGDVELSAPAELAAPSSAGNQHAGCITSGNFNIVALFWRRASLH